VLEHVPGARFRLARALLYARHTLPVCICKRERGRGRGGEIVLKADVFVKWVHLSARGEGGGEASCAVDHNRTEVLLYTLHRYYVCIERPTAVTDPARIALLRATGARITAGVGGGAQ
jgi:hypothetical protein